MDYSIFDDFFVVLVIVLMFILPFILVKMGEKGLANKNEKVRDQVCVEKISSVKKVSPVIDNSEGLKKEMALETIGYYILVAISLLALIVAYNAADGYRFDYEEFQSIIFYYAIFVISGIAMCWKNLFSRTFRGCGDFDRQKLFALWAIHIYGIISFYLFSEFPSDWNEISKSGILIYLFTLSLTIYFYLGWNKKIKS